jgi:hypothetical protein
MMSSLAFCNCGNLSAIILEAGRKRHECRSDLRQNPKDIISSAIGFSLLDDRDIEGLARQASPDASE